MVKTFTFRMRRKLFLSIISLSIVYQFILMSKEIIYPELQEIKFSDENLKSILMWKGFTGNPIVGREMNCPHHKCFITENRSVWSSLIGPDCRDTLLLLVEPYLAASRVYTITTDLEATKMKPFYIFRCVVMV